MQNHVITNFGRKITLNSEEEDVAIANNRERAYYAKSCNN